MNISKTSWHYSLIKTFLPSFKPVPENLCPYIRALTWRLLVIIALIIFGVFICSAVGLGMAAGLEQKYALNLFFDQSQHLNHWGWYPVLAVLGALGIAFACAAALGIVCGMFLVLHIIHKWWLNKGSASITDTIKQSDNIVIKYLHAKHSKICPKITFKD